MLNTPSVMMSFLWAAGRPATIARAASASRCGKTFMAARLSRG